MVRTHRRRWWQAVARKLVCSLLTSGAIWSFSVASAEDSPPKPELTAVQKERLKERGVFEKQCLELRQSGKLAEAIEAAGKMLAIEREVFGDEHDEVLGSKDFIAQVQEQREDFAAARRIREDILATSRKVSGVDHWRTADARRSLENIDVLEKLSPEDRRQLNQASLLTETVLLLHRQGKSNEALKPAAQVREIRKQVLGEKHLSYATSLSNLAELYSALGDSAKAEPFCREAAEIEQAMLGERHPRYTDSLNNLAVIYLSTGDLAKAEPVLRQALDIKHATLGVTHPDYVASREKLEQLQASMKLQAKLKKRDEHSKHATELRKQGKLAEAIAAAEKMLAVEQELSGKQHEKVLGTWDLIAQLHEQREDFGSARTAREEVLAIRTKAVGADHWRTSDARRALKNVDVLERLSSDDRRQLIQATLLNGTVVQLRGQGKSREALKPAGQVRDIRQKVLGEQHPDYANSLNNLALLYESLGDSAKAEPLYRQALDINRQVLGEQHPGSATSLNNLAMLYKSRGDFAKAEPLFRQALEINRTVLGEQHPAYATNLNNLAALYKSIGDATKAEPLYIQALEIRRSVLGELHPDYATSLNNLANLYASTGDTAKAEPLFRQALNINKVVLGEQHPSYAASLNNMAGLYKSMGDSAKAEPLYRKALEIQKVTLGEQHPDFATSLDNLAGLYKSSGDFARAEPLFRQALEIQRTIRGEKHPDYAVTLSNVADLYQSMGDNSKARPLCQQVLEIQKAALGETHPDYAISLNNIAILYEAMGDHALAEPLYRQALEIHRTVLGEKHPDCATSLNNLAGVYNAMGDYSRAEPLYRQALDIKQAVLGEAHPAYATGLINLAALYVSQHDYAKAEPLFRQSLAIQATTLGEKHPAYAANLSNLATLYELKEDHALAEPLVRQSVAITRGHVESTAAVQSERQQFAMARTNRGSLSLLLSVAVSSGKYADDIYQEVLLTKGGVWRRQQKTRAVQSDPQLAPLFTELRSVSARRAQQTLATPEPKTMDVWRQQIDQLAQRQEELERELSTRSAAYREAQQLVTVDELRACLPAGYALVDFWEYSQLMSPVDDKPGPPQFERRLVAFVIRPEVSSVTLIPLGAVKSLAQAIDTWRRSFGQSAEAVQAGQLLRERLWTPLEPHLADAKTVLASPDGVLGRFPLIALPGDKPGSYLLEQRALAIVPVPQAIVSLLKAKDPDRPAVAGNLLVLGDVDYDAQPDSQDSSVPKKKFGRSPAVVRGSDWRGFTPLPATRGELATIDKLYRDLFGPDGVTLLEKTEANEKRFRQEAPRHKYLHVATHGFFAPESLRSALKDSADRGARLSESDSSRRFVGYPPGLLSGLALAGANRPPDAEHDDGILTASEVESLDLRGVDLALLSACETGLGNVAGGEGLLGLQRAFQVAGARSVVASLWKVSDDATRSLMERFYDNLWQKEMSTLESLREAQLWMLKEGQHRGLVRLDQPQPAEAPKRTPPFYWAAFVLSGDWR